MLIAEPVDCLLADHESAAITASRHEKFLKRPPCRSGERSIPLSQSVKRIFALGVENEYGEGCLIHEELVDQSVIGLSTKVPQPNFVLKIVDLLSGGKAELRSPSSIC